MRRQLLSLYAVLGVIGGFVGLVAAIAWYVRNRDMDTADGYISGLAGLGPLVLGLFSLLILVLAVISIVALLASAKDDLED